MTSVLQTAWAEAKKNDDFVCIQTCSGHRSSVVDPRGKQHLLPIDVSDGELGEAVLDCLSLSRFVSPSEQPDQDRELFEYASISKRYSEWVKQLMDVYGYKNKQALFRSMKNCTIRRCNGVITVDPTHHDKLDAWSGDGMSDLDSIAIPQDAAPAVIGAALRLAFSRCT
jgi:hypothetical protein